MVRKGLLLDSPAQHTTSSIVSKDALMSPTMDAPAQTAFWVLQGIDGVNRSATRGSGLLINM